MLIETLFPSINSENKAQQIEQQNSLESYCLLSLRHASRARKQKKILYYWRLGACVCVCVSKFFKPAKNKELKDSRETKFPRIPITPLYIFFSV